MTSTAPKLLLITPCYGGQAHAHYMRSLLALEAACAKRGLPLAIDLNGGEALIGRGRSVMFAAFLRSEATHLLFVDADIAFAPEAVFRLLASGFDVVGGLYRKKTSDPTAVDAGTGLEADELPDATTRDDGFREVAAVGAGFLLVSRAAGERLTRGYPALSAKLGDLHGSKTAEAVMLFDSFPDPVTGRYLNDYQAFCRRWRDLGGEVWADTRSNLLHVGETALTA